MSHCRVQPTQSRRRTKRHNQSPGQTVEATGQAVNRALAQMNRVDREKGTVQPEARSKRMDAVAAHPLAELLVCPPSTGDVLNASARLIEFQAGETVFQQSQPCKGLYLVVSGQLQRRTERRDARLTLGASRPGDLVELAAALGDHRHTYSLIAQSAGSALLIPIEALHKAFESFPPMRMHLLEELAREVSRAYNLCTQASLVRTRRRGSDAHTA